MKARIYLRVSREDQADPTRFSLLAQERACRALADARGMEITGVYVDDGASAFSDSIEDRPAFWQALEDARKGEYDVLLVYALDRFARNMAGAQDWLRILDRSGVELASTSEWFDSSPAGRFTRNVLFSQAEFYSDFLSRRVHDALQEKARRGKHVGWPPFGYRYDAGKLAVDEPAAGGYRLAMKALLDGALTFREVAAILDAAGYRTNRGRRWRSANVAAMLRSPAYIGSVLLEDGTAIPGEHPPLVDRATWERVQSRCRSMAGHHLGISRGQRGYPLSGLLTCAECGERMVGMAFGRNKYRVYFCARRMYGGRAACCAPSFHADLIEDAIAALLDNLRLPEDSLERIEAATQEQGGETEAVASIEAEEKRIMRLYQRGYKEWADFEREWRALEQRKERLTPLPKEDVEGAADLLAMGVGRLWRESVDSAARKALARAVFEAVLVEGKESRSPVIRYVLWRPEVETLLGRVEAG